MTFNPKWNNGLIGSGSQTVAIVHNSTNQSLTQHANTTLSWDTIDDQSGTIFSNSHSSRFTAPVSGFYSITGTLILTDQSSGSFIAFLEKNGVAAIFQQLAGFSLTQVSTVTSNQGVCAPIASTFYLNAGDYVEVVLYTDTSGIQVINGGGGNSFITVSLLGSNGVTPAQSAIVHNSTNQALTQNSDNYLSWDTVDSQTGYIFSSTNPSRFTAPVAGYYSMSGTLMFTNGGSGAAICLLVKNHTTAIQQLGAMQLFSTTASQGLCLPIATTFFLNAGDYVEVDVYPTGSGNSVINTGGGHSFIVVSLASAATFTGISFNQRTATTTTAISSLDYLVRADATSGAFTATLPPAASVPGQQFILKKIDSTSNAVTLKGNGSETIEGFNTQVVSDPYATIVVMSNSTSWDLL